MAFILAGVAIAATGLLVAITDDMSSGVVGGLGTAQSTNLLQSVGDAYKNALDQTSGIPLFGVFLGAIILAIGAFVLWLELIIRDAAIYVCVFFLPLTFVAMIWPATSRWARRLVELLVAIVLAKFVIVSILSLASAALTNTSLVQGDGNTFERMIAGAALLVLAAWSPFALLRVIPMMEAAAVDGRQSARVDLERDRAPRASRHRPRTCGRRWTDTRGRLPPASPEEGPRPPTSAGRSGSAPRPGDDRETAGGRSGGASRGGGRATSRATRAIGELLSRIGGHGTRSALAADPTAADRAAENRAP